MLCRAMADGLQGVAGHRAVNWRADGMQRADGCCAGGRQVLRRTTADGLQGGRPDVVPCVADGL